MKEENPGQNGESYQFTEDTINRIAIIDAKSLIGKKPEETLFLINFVTETLKLIGIQKAYLNEGSSNISGLNFYLLGKYKLRDKGNHKPLYQDFKEQVSTQLNQTDIEILELRLEEETVDNQKLTAVYLLDDIKGNIQISMNNVLYVYSDSNSIHPISKANDFDVEYLKIVMPEDHNSESICQIEHITKYGRENNYTCAESTSSSDKPKTYEIKKEKANSKRRRFGVEDEENVKSQHKLLMQTDCGLPKPVADQLRELTIAEKIDMIKELRAYHHFRKEKGQTFWGCPMKSKLACCEIAIQLLTSSTIPPTEKLETRALKKKLGSILAKGNSQMIKVMEYLIENPPNEESRQHVTNWSTL